MTIHHATFDAPCCADRRLPSFASSCLGSESQLINANAGLNMDGGVCIDKLVPCPNSCMSAALARLGQAAVWNRVKCVDCS
jgi:hypothetical protein